MDRLTALLRAGRFAEAIAAASAEARAHPRAPAAWVRLVQAQLAAERLEAALAASEAGLAACPGDPDLLCMAGQVLLGLSRVDAARDRLHAALARAPGHFGAAFGLARLAVEDGRWAEAEALLERLRSLAPDRPDLEWLSAETSAGRGDLEAARRTLEAVAVDPRVSPAQKAGALLRLGDILDRLGKASQAFAAAAQGKAIQRALYAERAAGRESVTARFRRLEAWFRAADAAPWRQAPQAAASPRDPSIHVFLVGFPRSGTTLLELALAGAPEVVSLEEAPTLASAHAEFLADPEGLRRLAALDSAEAAAWREAYWTEVRSRGVDPAGRVFLDKAPAGTEDLPLVAKLFPSARVLFALRDPRDVVLSCFRQDFQMNALTYAFTELAEAAGAYDAAMALADAYRRILPLEVTEIRHEKLLEDVPEGLRRICDRLGLAWDPRMADPAATARDRSVRTPSAAQVREGVNRKGVARWRRYAAELAPVLPALAPWIARYGYPAA
ncbi:MAG: sulfotransferase [Alphaproteobacteria bacterium]|nr:sulfotransferase [Alphaproteobacteria bacterium]